MNTLSSAINIITTGVAIALRLLGRLDIFGRDQQIYDTESCKWRLPMNCDFLIYFTLVSQVLHEQ